MSKEEIPNKQRNVLREKNLSTNKKNLLNLLKNALFYHLIFNIIIGKKKIFHIYI